MDSSTQVSRLTPLQRDLLEQFFSREQRLFLTGGAALAGFYFGHRDTDDLDLFALPELDLAEPAAALAEATSAVGGTLKRVSEYRDFRRYLATRGAEVCVVDLIVDRAPAIETVKVARGSIRLDSLREIAANKICTILGRSEIRDLVDLRALLDSGLDLRAALVDAAHKEAGADPATLAWVIEQLRIAPDAKLPGGVSAHDLLAFRDALAVRLRALAFEDVKT